MVYRTFAEIFHIDCKLDENMMDCYKNFLTNIFVELMLFESDTLLVFLIKPDVVSFILCDVSSSPVNGTFQVLSDG